MLSHKKNKHLCHLAYFFYFLLSMQDNAKYEVAGWK